MNNVTIKDIVEVTGGTLLCGDDSIEIKEFAIDSRQGDKNSIFVPIIGERVDAHRFIDSALEHNGATFTSEHDSADGPKPWIKVDDTVEAMQKVGTFYRNKMNLPVVAVTGSVGKTTTREMISWTLSSGMKVFQTLGNQNSQIGVPLTLSHISPEDEVAVLEIGMSERGQIEKLTKMIRPNIGVVTLIGVSHIAQLKSQENICLEKMDIIKGIPDDGMLFLNGDDPFLIKYRGKLKLKTFFYGLGEACDYRAKDIHQENGETVFTFLCEGLGEEGMEVRLSCMGDHFVRNALVALGISHRMGLDLTLAAKSLASFSGQRQKLIRCDRCTLIDDTYNASPDSMRASIKVLSELGGITGKKIAVLSDMLELGENERRYHYEVGTYLAGTKIDRVAVYGELSKELLRGVREHNDAIECIHFETKEELIRYLLDNVKPEDALLLKASNGMKLKEVAEILQK